MNIQTSCCIDTNRCSEQPSRCSARLGTSTSTSPSTYLDLYLYLPSILSRYLYLYLCKNHFTSVLACACHQFSSVLACTCHQLLTIIISIFPHDTCLWLSTSNYWHPQSAGNCISGRWNFKISWGRPPPAPSPARSPAAWRGVGHMSPRQKL